MARYRLTPQARTGFRNILEYVERDFGVRVAERVLDRIESAFELLAESPGIGHSREDLTTDDRIQFWTVGPTLIAYRPGIDIVEILIVERGERDWERLLETEL
ncbi:MAG: type II toxin-antitoxin system RelE/ParE family toxin [Planctomycetota bacterium]